MHGLHLHGVAVAIQRSRQTSDSRQWDSAVIGRVVIVRAHGEEVC